jgi:hypothetical protein
VRAFFLGEFMKSGNFRKKIENINLDRIVDKISSKDLKITHLSKSWSKLKAIEAVKQYKRYLWVVKKYQRKYKFLPPSEEIDFIWHSHILDTRSYFKDCRAIFNRPLHHDPYFGLNGKSDRKKLHLAFQTTQLLYFKEFGEYIYSLEDL